MIRLGSRRPWCSVSLSVKLGNWWVDCITPRANQPLIIKPDVLSNVYQMLYHCLFLVIIALISTSLLNLAFMLKLSLVAYSLLLPKEHILELLV